MHLSGQENATGYALVSRESRHRLCNTCGTFVYVDILGQNVDIAPMNVRTIEGIDFDGLKYQTYDSRSVEPVCKGEIHGKSR